MKLGNTGGKNKGKKYLRITGLETITPENRQKAESFKEWFGSMYSKLQIELINKDTYNEDVLNDTFLRIYDKILFGGLEIIDNKSYFHRAFFTNFMQSVINESKKNENIISDYEYVDLVDDAIEIEESIKAEDNLYREVLKHVVSNFGTDALELILAYMSIKAEKKNIKTLANLMDVKEHILAHQIRTIKKSVQENTELSNKRKSM